MLADEIPGWIQRTTEALLTRDSEYYKPPGRPTWKEDGVASSCGSDSNKRKSKEDASSKDTFSCNVIYLPEDEFVDVANGWPKRRMKKVYEGHPPITRSVTKILKNQNKNFEYVVVPNPTLDFLLILCLLKIPTLNKF